MPLFGCVLSRSPGQVCAGQAKDIGQERERYPFDHSPPSVGSNRSARPSPPILPDTEMWASRRKRSACVVTGLQRKSAPDRSAHGAAVRAAVSPCGRLVCLVLIVLTALLLVSCAGGGSLAPVRESTGKSAGKPEYHVVRRGDTLYAIAWRYGYDYRQLAQWNGIRPPYVIYPGQRLRLGASAGRPANPGVLRSGSGKPAAGQAARQTAPSRTEKPKGGSASRPAASAPPSRSARIVWRWPVDGKIVRAFDSDQPGRKGVAIAGRLGQPVRAAAPGKVVYSGSGLVGYGQLIIVKHDETYLSAYGFNRKLLVQEEDEVRGGQVIAEMGTNGTDGPMLHFEIRSNGKPVDPLRYLPPR